VRGFARTPGRRLASFVRRRKVYPSPYHHPEPHSLAPLMTIAETCILVACLLPIACAGVAKSKGFRRPRREGGYDNHSPRLWLASLKGWQARANAAQQNSFEALPIFIAGVLVAERMQSPQSLIDGLAIAFLAARVGYIGAYLADRANLRSLLWVLGLACCIAMFFTRQSLA
jgi:uncharacterized MAPEG superfamily protein